MALTSDDLRRYWANIDAALEADPDGWAEYEQARQSWDAALSQGRKRDAGGAHGGASGDPDPGRTAR